MREHQREPDIVELARAMNVPKEEVVFALDAILDRISLFEPVFMTAPTRSASWTRSATRAIRTTIARRHRPARGHHSLDDREKRIIACAFRGPHPDGGRS